MCGRHDDGKMWMRNCPKCGRQIKYKSEKILKISIKNNTKCKSCSSQKTFHFSKPLSVETKRKMRLAAIKNLIKQKIFVNKLGPRFNIKACKYFDELNKTNGWSLIHALNGGEYYIKELGYWIDAYDKNKNIVVEYDEKHHSSSKQKEKDLKRMTEIIKYLHCEFLRYNESKKELKEYDT
jgi:hypothetical protein